MNRRQVQAVLHMRTIGMGLTNKGYRELTGASKRTASRDLEELLSLGVVDRVGETGRGTRYVLEGPERGQRGHNGAGKGPKGSGKAQG